MKPPLFHYPVSGLVPSRYLSVFGVREDWGEVEAWGNHGKGPNLNPLTPKTQKSSNCIPVCPVSNG